jgi:hypothetical protein
VPTTTASPRGWPGENAVEFCQLIGVGVIGCGSFLSFMPLARLTRQSQKAG